MDAIVGARAERRRRRGGHDGDGRPSPTLRCAWSSTTRVLERRPAHHGRRRRRRVPHLRTAGARGARLRLHHHAPEGRSPRPPAPTGTVERILALRGHGMHRLAGALREAQVQVAGARGWATRRAAAALGLPGHRGRRDVCGAQPRRAPPPSSPRPRTTTRPGRLARETGARVAAIPSVLDVPAALNDASPTTGPERRVRDHPADPERGHAAHAQAADPQPGAVRQVVEPSPGEGLHGARSAGAGRSRPPRRRAARTRPGGAHVGHQAGDGGAGPPVAQQEAGLLAQRPAEAACRGRPRGADVRVTRAGWWPGTVPQATHSDATTGDHRRRACTRPRRRPPSSGSAPREHRRCRDASPTAPPVP